MNIERKNFDTLVKADPDGTIEAIVSVFANQDRGKEVVKPGAFKNSISRKLPKGVWSHDWTQPVAKTLDARELAPGDPLLPTAISALGGLYVKGQFNLETQAGREAYSNIKFGIIDEFSIGYTVVKDSIDEKSSVRELHELDLYEWSPVLVGMNTATQLLSIKAAPPQSYAWGASSVNHIAIPTGDIVWSGTTGTTTGESLSTKRDDGTPALRLAEHSEAVLATCEEFAVRIKSLRDLRAKEGRVISAATRGRIQTAIDGMTACVADLSDLMTMGDPPAKASDAEVRRVYAEVLKTMLALS